MFAQNLESVNVSFTKFEYFQPLFQVRFSSVLSNDMNVNSWVIDPQVPELCSFFLCVLFFSLSFRLGSFYLSVFWVTAFFCLHHSAGFCVLVIVFFSSEISFWLFFISLLSTPPPFFFKPRHNSSKEESSSYSPNLLLTSRWWGCWDAWLYLGERRCLIYPWSLLALVGMWPQFFFPVVWLSGRESTCHAGDTGDTGLISGSGRSPGRGHAHSLQYFGQENSMGRGAWWATIHRVSKSRIWLKQPSEAKHEHMFVWSKVIALFFLLSRLTLLLLWLERASFSWSFCSFLDVSGFAKSLAPTLDYMRQKENSGDLTRHHSLDPEIPS